MAEYHFETPAQIAIIRGSVVIGAIMAAITGLWVYIGLDHSIAVSLAAAYAAGMVSGGVAGIFGLSLYDLYRGVMR